MTKIEKQVVDIPMDGQIHKGSLVVPPEAIGIVLFAHGSGSSRLSPRNNFVANHLNERSIATLLFDLLTETEDLTYETRFDIDLLTRRLLLATKWLKQQSDLRDLSVGFFGASTGAAAALKAAAELGDEVAAIVSRGGRPDMADVALARVQAPTLFIVGGLDDIVIELNKQAYATLTCIKELEIIPGATHLFEEAGKLESVADSAGRWFQQYLQKKQQSPYNNVRKLH